MGVPKFFRFISSRYPCINKIIKEHEIPVYDNLYIDMNSIIHTCSHPTDSDVYFRVGQKEFSDEDIFQNVCRYVELIYRMVKPTELMYLAFDGVAPRAKINQQRATRFRVAKDVQSIEEKKNLYGDEIFDGNCITPGTIFMTDLIDHMRHFIAYKISTDALWQQCQIILSGSEVPGEGEHKIMQFIRYNKTQPNYNPNTRHCLYSLDADLIMLGLCTHEPHFSLLREKDAFGKRKKMLTPEETDFHLLHLSLVREYLEYEFAPLKSKLKFSFDLEKVIDDWILIGFLVGNDFIPQLPDLHIQNGALPLLYQTYIKVLPDLDGYINVAGELHLGRFEKFIRILSHIEKNFTSHESQINIIRSEFAKINIDSEVMTQENKLESEIQKKKYYKEKFKFDNIDESTVFNLVNQYVRAIQWTLNYYYQGCCSWSWYYPYHYAPFISDIKNLQDISVQYDISKPFLPLQHLLAVLPPGNCHLLPVPMRSLLTSSKSPIIDFYPTNFEVDLNGKTNDWEAIVLLPFIDEEKLLKAMEPYNAKLSMKERKRNMSGLTCSFTYTKTSLGQYPVDTVFDPFINHAQLEHINIEDMFVPKDKLIKGLCCNVRFDSFPGFPTLKHVPHSFEIESIEFKSISNKSNKVETMTLTVKPKPISDFEKIASELLGRTVYINWPYLKKAHVIGITNFKDKIFLDNFWKKFSSDNIKRGPVSESEISKLRKETVLISELYKSIGINIGETEVLVFLFPITGKRYTHCNSGQMQLQSKWSSLSKLFPYQVIVKELKLQKVTFPLCKSVSEIFTESSVSFMIGYPNYGSFGTIKKLINQQKISISLNVTPEPNFAVSDEDFFASYTDFKSCNAAAKTLGVNCVLISRISGSLIVHESELDESKYHDIGLHMKIPKQNKELFGYTKKKNDSWFYSSKAIELIKTYMEKFPVLFTNLKNNVTSNKFTLQNLFSNGGHDLNLVKSWLDEQKLSDSTFLECGTKSVGYEGVLRIEKFVDDFFSKKLESKTIEENVAPQMLFRPGMIFGLVPPDIKAQHKLLDRIICIRNNFTVPLGLKGTIIGIQEKDDKWKNIYEILFDSSFIGGLTLYTSSEHRCYRLTVADFLNISFGQRNAQSASVKSTDASIKNPKKNTSNRQSYENNRNSRNEQTVPIDAKSNNNNKPTKKTNSNSRVEKTVSADVKTETNNHDKENKQTTSNNTSNVSKKNYKPIRQRLNEKNNLTQKNTGVKQNLSVRNNHSSLKNKSSKKKNFVQEKAQSAPTDSVNSNKRRTQSFKRNKNPIKNTPKKVSNSHDTSQSAESKISNKSKNNDINIPEQDK